MPVSEAEVADIERITSNIEIELRAMLDKLSWWKLALIGLSAALAIFAALATCTSLAAAITTASGGTGAPVAVMAYIKCILAALGLIAAFLATVLKLISVGSEGAVILGKVKAQQEVLKSDTESGG